MIRIATATLAAAVAFAATPSFAATSAEAPFVVAQGLDVHVGPGGPEFRERRIIRERRMRDEDRCRTVIVRRHTPNGTITRRTRTCD